MKKIIFLFLLLPSFIFPHNVIDSLKIIKNEIEIKNLKNNSNELQQKYDYQIKINEQTLNSISSQIGATSYNLSIFAFLFGLLAILLGVYVTWVERKIISLKDENERLLKETKKTKEEVVVINDLIQKDIYGLFLKIKREETFHILNRLVNVPDDIQNLSEQLFSRDLMEEDFSLLKKAYLKLDRKHVKGQHSYKLLFFQHFLDQSIRDEEIGGELLNHYSDSVSCANENDMIKSTKDFMKAILDLGFQTKHKEINSYVKAISNSSFKNLESLYKLIFDSLKTRNDRFKFYEVISNEKEIRIGKVNYGLLLVENYEGTELSESEIGVINQVKEIKEQLEKEREEARLEEEKKKQEQEKKKMTKELPNKK